jgi:hypothetical protein
MLYYCIKTYILTMKALFSSIISKELQKYEMFAEKLVSYMRTMEDPKRPLLGPTLNGIQIFGVIQSGKKTRDRVFMILNTYAFIFVLTELVEVYFLTHDIHKMVKNFSVTAISIMCCAKLFSVVFNQSRWLELTNQISQVEIMEIEKQNPETLKVMEQYTRHARILTYFYWIAMFITYTLTVVTPFLKFILSASYREDITNEFESYPEVLSSWFPFDNSAGPGYFLATILQVLVSLRGSAIVALFDSNAFVVMVFLKGQMQVLRRKCINIFDHETNANPKVTLDNIIECHRHHNFILK